MAFLTKGQIPDKTINLLLCHAYKVRAQIGIITHDENIRHLFEPNAASINMRLKQMTKMTTGGIWIEARLIPIIPGITDTTDSIERLYNAIADSGVKNIAISALFLRPAIVVSLKHHILDKHLLNNVLSFYQVSNRLKVRAGQSSIIPLSRQKRDGIYARFRQLANKYNLNLSICGCMNPDIGGFCNITGNWPENEMLYNLFDREA